MCCVNVFGSTVMESGAATVGSLPCLMCSSAAQQQSAQNIVDQSLARSLGTVSFGQKSMTARASRLYRTLE